jgi:hypothetical protein
MHDAFGVSGLKCVHDLSAERDDRFDVERPATNSFGE